MKKLFKRTGTVLIVLLALVIALAIALPMLIDPNDYKDRIAAEVEDRTGRELTITGDLELTVFPWLGVRSGAMSLAQAPGFDDEVPFASFGVAEARVKLLPLLFRGEFDIGQIALEGLDLNLERDADGNDNWSDIVEHERGTVAEPEDADGDGFDLENLEIAGIVLADARISFRDAQAGTSYTIEELNLSTGTVTTGAPVGLSLDARVTSGVPQWRGTVAFDGSADFRPDAETVALIVERAEVSLEGGALPVGRLDATLRARIDGDLAQERWQVGDLELTATGSGGRLPDREFTATVSGAVSADLAAQTASLTDFRFDGAGVSARFAAEGTQVLDAPVFTGRAEVQAFSPREVLESLGRTPPETADPTALTHLQFEGRFEATPTSIAFDEMTAQLDASRLSGRFAVADFGRQALRFDLDLDSIDLDRYLPPETPQTEDVDAGALDDIPVPVELIRGLDIDGDARIGSLRATGIASQDVVVTIKAEGGVLRVNPASAKLYGGTYNGDVTVDVRGDLPRIAIDERVVGVQAGPLFEDVFGATRITGTAELSAKLTGTGENIGQIRQTLDGRVAFAFRDGAVQGLNLYHLIRDARAVLRREPRPPAAERNETPFGALTGSGVVARGVMTNDDLAGQMPFMRLDGRGKIDLAQQTMDYRLGVEILDTPGVEGREGDAELEGRRIPVIISGPFDELNYKVDIAEVFKEEAKDRVKDVLRDKLKDIFP